jgi:hypothetical protein
MLVLALVGYRNSGGRYFQFTWIQILGIKLSTLKLINMPSRKIEVRDRNWQKTNLTHQ